MKYWRNGRDSPIYSYDGIVELRDIPQGAVVLDRSNDCWYLKIGAFLVWAGSCN